MTRAATARWLEWVRWTIALLWALGVARILVVIYVAQGALPALRSVSSRVTITVAAGVGLILLLFFVTRALSGRAQTLILVAFGALGTVLAALWMRTAPAWFAGIAVFLLAWVVGLALWPWTGVSAGRSVAHFLQVTLGLQVFSLLGLLWSLLHVWSVPLMVLSALGLAAISLLLFRVTRRAALPAPIATEEPRLSPLEWIMAFALLGLGIVVVLFASLPDLSCDALVQHLPVAQYIARNDYLPVTDLYYTLVPHGFHMILAFCLGVGGMPDATFTHALFGLLAVFGTIALGASLYSRKAGLVAAILLVSSPLLLWLATVAYTDLSGMVYALALAICLTQFRTRGGPGWAALAGANLGMLLSIKYYGLLFLPVACGLLLARIREDRAAPTARVGLLAIAVLALTGGPWLARTWLLTASPIFPLMASVFPSPYWDSSPFYLECSGVPRTPLNLLLTPYFVTARTHLFAFSVPDGYAGGLLLLVWPLWLLAPLAFTKGRWLLGVIALTYLAGQWAFVQNVRFTVVVWPLLALLAGGALTTAWERRAAPRLMRWGAAAAVASVCLVGLSRGWLARAGDLQAIARRTPREQYLIARMPGYMTLRWVAEHVPPDARILDQGGAYGSAYAQHYITFPTLPTLRDASIIKGWVDGAALWRDHEIRYLLAKRQDVPVLAQRTVGTTVLLTEYDDGTLALLRLGSSGAKRRQGSRAGEGGAATGAPPKTTWQLAVFDTRLRETIARGRVEIVGDSYRISLRGRAPFQFTREEAPREGEYILMPVAPGKMERFRATAVQQAVREMGKGSAAIRLEAASGQRSYLLSRERN